MKIFLWRVLLVVSLTLSGLLAGAFFGGNFLVPRGAGLAGGVMVVWYALFGAAAAGIVGLIVGLRADARRLRKVALIAFAAALVLYLILAGFVALGSRADRDATALPLSLPD